MTKSGGAKQVSIGCRVNACIGLAGVLALAACATTPGVPESSKQIRPVNGYMVASVSRTGGVEILESDASYVARFWFESGLIDSEGRNELAEYGSQHGQIIVLELEPGDYKISKAELFLNRGSLVGQTWVDLSEKYEPTFPTMQSFRIKTGEVTYIGNLHIDIDLTSGRLGHRKVTATRTIVYDQAARDLPEAYKEEPAIADLPVNKILASVAAEPVAQGPIVGKKISAIAMSCKKPYVLSQDCSLFTGAKRKVEIDGFKMKIAGSEDGSVVVVMDASGKWLADSFLLVSDFATDAARSGFQAVREALTSEGIAIRQIRPINNFGFGAKILGYAIELDADGYSVLKGFATK